MRVALVICTWFATALAFVPPSTSVRHRALRADPDDEGYAPIGSLIRQGPVPFFIRLVDPDKYERSVQKYMLEEGCGRREAQGNMDAYFENPTSWTLQKLREKDGAPKYDYATANTTPKQLILTAAWALIVLALGTKIFLFGW
ncbi:hypothetical protein CTAYLR_007161 [Chrysophaeum taylorii]|uniref:Uncharacterized protein n=1 Tax=Chrysophaeum taylorii TaxID=2483200 RepID=A0AAD7UMT8_9STRA|nr:hypothetical protein CTAYLR_007161 [Chrysophaeum taylorii]